MENTEEQKPASQEQIIEIIVKAVEGGLNDYINVCKEHCEREQVPFIGINRLEEFKNHYLKTYRDSALPPPVEIVPDPKPMDAHDDLGGAKKPE